jgi:hypothetical protein
MLFSRLPILLLCITDPTHEKYNRNVILYIDLWGLFYLKNIVSNVLCIIVINLAITYQRYLIQPLIIKGQQYS